MPQSLSHIVVHIVFSTKDRRPMIDQEIQDKFHAYLATVGKNQGCHVYRVGGVEDHVHIATTLSRSMSVAKLVEKLKTSSSAWIKEQAPRYENFYWQRGYGAFSVSPTHVDDIVAYISRQRQHHVRTTFQEELRSFLRRYGIKYDEQYVWD